MLHSDPKRTFGLAYYSISSQVGVIAMNLFRLSLDSLKWSDVLEFCEQREPEDATLDYKESIPKDIEKTVAAMENTLGGIIIVGVSEDDEAKPVLPLLGMEMRRGLVEQITRVSRDGGYCLRCTDERCSRRVDIGGYGCYDGGHRV